MIGIFHHAPLLIVDQVILSPFEFNAVPNHHSLLSLDYIDNVSIVNYLALVLCINFFLSPPSCRSREDPYLPLITLVRRLSKIFLLLHDFFLLIYNMVVDGNDNNSIDTTGLGFDTLDGLCIRFGEHWKNNTVHTFFDVAYSQNLLNLDDLFSDGAAWTQLK